MRVLHVIDSLAGSGGAENRMVDEAVAMTDRFDQRLVRLFERDELQGRVEDEGIPVIALGYEAARAARTWALAARSLRAFIDDWRPDVVHSALATGNLVAQLAARPLGLPVLSTFNRTGDLELQLRLQPYQRSWKAQLMRSVARRAAGRGDVHFRALNAYTRDTNCRLLGIPTDRATVIPRGVSVNPSSIVTARETLGLPAAGPLFVTVGRMVPEKAQHLLIDALASARTSLPEARLALVGPPGPAEPAVRAAIARHRLEDAVLLLGFRIDARSVIAASDVFVFSSLSEGSPGVVVEAMAVGTPVAAFAIPPVVELTDGGRHARLATSGSAEALGRAMVDAYRSPTRGDDARAAQAWAGSFDLDVIAGRLGDLLEARARRSAARVR
jgi:glycosyltransferase involved in cell wall biosynthesis